MDILISGHICFLTVFVGLRHLAFNRCGLISADGVCLISIDLVGLVFSDVDILIPSHGRGLIAGDIVDLTASDIVDLTASHGIGLLASDFVQLIAADGGREIAAYGIRHIAGGVVHDILCIVCDSAVFGSIGNSFRFHLNGRFLPICRSDIMPNLISSLIDGAGAVLIGHRCLFSSYRLCIGQR